MLRRDDLRLPATGAPAGVAELGARLIVDPDRLAPNPVVACCFAGGGMTARYWELAGSYDAAAHLAAAGVAVLTLDHPGTGHSDQPDDPWTLTPDVVAATEGAAVGAALEQLRAGTLVDHLPALPALVPVGVGHSMGAMLVAHQQAGHRLYAGVALLGHSGRGLPEALLPEESAVAGDTAAIRRSLVELARARFADPLPRGSTTASPFLVGPDLPPDAAEAIGVAGGGLLACCGLASMIPGSHDDALAAVDVPVLVGLAEHDIAGDPWQAPTWLTGSTDVTLHVLAGAHHNHNVAPTRREQWDRLVTWATTVPGARSQL